MKELNAAQQLLASLGVPYEMGGDSVIGRIRGTTAPKFRKTEVRAANKRARIARRLNRKVRA